ncbi:MAG: hypothetical protein V7703_15970 [Hyphomicrobiales bacterium]
MSWLTVCATASFEAAGLAACQPVVEYSREFQAQAGHQLSLLPEGSAVVAMIAGCGVMRDQARQCRRR